MLLLFPGVHGGRLSRDSSMRRKGHSYPHKGKNADSQNPFRIAGHLTIPGNHAGFTGAAGPQPLRLWDAWRYAYPEGRPATQQTLLIE